MSGFSSWFTWGLGGGGTGTETPPAPTPPTPKSSGSESGEPGPSAVPSASEEGGKAEGGKAEGGKAEGGKAEEGGEKTEVREIKAIDTKVELEDADWFHGLLPRTEIVPLLGEEGAWLVRSTEKESGLLIVISVKWKGAVKHLILKRTDRGWSMPAKNFKTVPELVDHYFRTGEPMNEAGMTIKGRPIPRNNWMAPTKAVKIEKKIGEGNFGEVFIGKLRRGGEWIPVALKTCKSLVGKNEKEEFMKEAKIMIAFQHPNVARIYAVAADKPPLMLVLELCSGGSLDKYLEKNKPSPLNTKVRFCMEGARGMEYLAVKRNCIHRDLAARNVLLGGNIDVKIADFGLTRQGTYQMSANSNHQIPVRWTAPEALTSGCFTKETDVWSYGVLMWEILTDALEPWPDKTVKEAFKAMKSGEKMKTPPGTPPQLEALLHRTWDLSPKKRPDMSDLRAGLEGIYAAVTGAPAPPPGA